MGDYPTDQAPIEPSDFSEENLPVSQSDSDAAPPLATPRTPQTGIVEQAGIVGGKMAYERAGVLELGGSAGLVSSSDFTQHEVEISASYVRYNLSDDM